MTIDASAEAEPSSPPGLWADVNLLVVVLLWGLNIPIMKFALKEMDKFDFNAIRLVLSVLTLGAFVWIRKSKSLDRSPDAPSIARQVLNIGLFALLSGLFYQVLFLTGIDSTSAGNTALILTSIPMWIAVLAFVFLRERLGAVAWSGLLLAFAGVVVVTLARPGSNMVTGSLKGNLIVVSAALMWAISSVWAKPMMKRISPIALTFWSIAISVPFHLMLAGDLGDSMRQLGSRPVLLAALCYSGVFSTGFATAMWNIGVKQVGPSHAAGFQNLVPVIALLAGWWLIGEVPYALQIAGGALIITGVITMRMRRNVSGLGSDASNVKLK